MVNTYGRGLTRLSVSVPSVLMVWQIGRQLMAQAGSHSRSRRWARVGVAGAALAGVAAMLVAVTRTGNEEASRQARLRDRLDHELEDSFPASDPPAVTRSGGRAPVPAP